ncbi:DNA polymerase III subunit epsilon [Labrys monachus]|uniref:DNA polymerase III subunit epsilon n=1 Tax=Labrys monachus TaxID=217067 RepID=A0ABU0FNE5_9HYPH|nr:DNA polymerase III subunit epsilon [Labrys monachus]MDQ0396051.1 DNA polymerase-3 subunit epsilon [Labrys monachus]
MREIILDTETTGLDPNEGHRLVEIGCIEMIDRLPTGVTWHRYFNPERDMPQEAFAVHGLSKEFLSDKPLFKELAGEFVAFVGEAHLVIHNAGFDMRFLNAELKRVNQAVLPMDRVIDTLAMARRKHPGARASLDELCQRYGIDNSKRVKHGALLDAEILAEVYIELTGGRQTTLGLATASAAVVARAIAGAAGPRPVPLPSRLLAAELAAHEAFVAALGDNAIWKKYA